MNLVTREHGAGRAHRAGAGTVLAAALLVLPAASASAEPADLIEARTTAVSLHAPAPGESQTFDLSVTSVTDTTVPLVLTVAGQSGGLLSGPTPVEVALVDDAGGPVLAPSRADKLLGTRLDLPDLAAGAGYHLTGTVTLPADAGDEYQGATGQVVFRFQVATDSPATSDPAPAPGAATSSGLATTGATVAAAVAAVAVLVTTGAWLLAARRRRSSHA